MITDSSGGERASGNIDKMKGYLVRVLQHIIFASSIASVYNAVIAPLAQPAPEAPATTSYVFNVTVAQRAPDCFGKIQRCAT